MFLAILTLSVLSPLISTLSIGTVSEQNVIEPHANASEFFPDWVPFKNKHGEDLGEFVQVEAKPKPKKRLALPVNFILRAVAEPEGDDYYDKGQGESENEDDFEKKEWSDLNRPVNEVSVNHTAISEIDDVVDIINKNPNDPILEALNRGIVKNDKIEPEKVDEESEVKEEKQKDIEEDKISEKTGKEKEKDEEDYDEGSSEKNKTEIKNDEQIEAEAKKARILDSVDQLKERHAQEQRVISEKIREEELFSEERERDKIPPVERQDKYNIRRKSKHTPEDYDEYNEAESLEEKYKKQREQTSTTETPKRMLKKKRKKTTEPGKLSVFRNPRVFMMYDDEGQEVTTAKPTKTPTRGKDRFSSKYQSTPKTDVEESERISLLPDDTESKEGEPTKFFPKKRKGTKKRIRLTSPATDSTVAETIPNRLAKELTTLDTTGYTTAVEVDTQTAADVTSRGEDAAPSASNANTEVKDAVPASSDHKKAAGKVENYSREKGGGREYHSDHEEEHAEHGKKAYEGFHEDTKAAKGHHDKENHLGKYEDQGGMDKEHHHETGHYGAHHHEEHGKKHAKYEESGKHAKGHSTKGSHDIHKKEEYEKKVEFFEEEGDSADEEKNGGYNNENEHSSGGHFKKGNLEADHHHRSKGDSGSFAKGGHVHVHKGHKLAEGHDGHGHHGRDFYKKNRGESGKKWMYHHGNPAKTAKLTLIDRRGDQYFHGPQYYG
ncbi:hypothetical protein K1T71_011650 [Dendrolimus kikuchii]|uniref:Uncharacterized protein n=1 Tax=Dendrolimus kikuchii TaxID=765133 RepID=A0ACC1CLT5_9NEOP|nr:hypothetical protein K1T71_011650 [Dendrolimus kikuchii]